MDFQAKIVGFLAVPIKRTVVVDWTGQMKVCLANLEEDVGSFGGEIASLNKLRTDAQGAEGNPAGLGLIYRYYHQLDSMINRFPALQRPQIIQFEWCDAFDNNSKVQQSSLAFEKANLAFNLASILSRIATSKAPGCNTYASMAQHFQAAGSMFVWISETFLHPPLVDLQSASLHFLSELMLAQAQECVLLRAMAEGKSPGTLSKLAAALVGRYDRCAGLLQSPEGSALADSLSSGCRAMVEGKSLYYGAFAQAWKASTLLDGDGQGEAIARLKKAAELLHRLDDRDEEVGLFDSEHQGDIFRKTIEKAEHENGFIYHANVPDVLTKIDTADLTRILPFREVLDELGIEKSIANAVDLFRRVLPQKTLIELSKYSEETSKIIRYEGEKAAEADDELTLLRTRIESEKEQSIDSFNSNSYIEARLAEISPLEDNIKSEKQKIIRLKAVLESCRLLVHEDSAKLQANLAKFSQSWTQNPLVVNLEEELCGLEMIQKEINVLSKEYSQQVSKPLSNLLDRVLSQQEGQGRPSLIGEDSMNAFNDLTKLSAQLDQLAQRRSVLISELRGVAMQDDISEKLVALKQSKADLLVEAELRKFDRPCLEIEENIAEHKALVAKLQSLLEDLQRERSQKRSSLGIDEMERSCASILNYCQKLSEQLETNGLAEQERRIDLLHRDLAQTVDKRKVEAGALQKELEDSSAFRTQQLLKAKLSALSLETAPVETPPPAPESASNNKQTSSRTFEPSLLD